MKPRARYAKSGDVHIAYATMGDGNIDLVVVPGFISHVEITWENPLINRFGNRVGRFARIIVFDKRGTGMSDPVAVAPTLEERMDDIRAVMDAAESRRAFVLGVSEGAPLSVLFAAAHPDRVAGLILAGGMARSTWAPDYPWATPREALLESAAEFTAPNWGTGQNVEIFAPSLASDPEMVEWWARLERNAIDGAREIGADGHALDRGDRPDRAERLRPLFLHRRDRRHRLGRRRERRRLSDRRLNLLELHEPERADDQRGHEQHHEHSFQHVFLVPASRRPAQ